MKALIDRRKQKERSESTDRYRMKQKERMVKALVDRRKQKERSARIKQTEGSERNAVKVPKIQKEAKERSESTDRLKGTCSIGTYREKEVKGTEGY